MTWMLFQVLVDIIYPAQELYHDIEGLKARQLLEAEQVQDGLSADGISPSCIEGWRMLQWLPSLECWETWSLLLCPGVHHSILSVALLRFAHLLCP